MASELPVSERQGTSGGPERIGCWLCGWPIVVRSTQGDRINLFCLECGMQVGIHSATGARRLRELVERSKSGLEPRGAFAG
ncbi:MAG: hypothetical protein ACKVXR_12305 [Planctomycetota bacterium]